MEGGIQSLANLCRDVIVKNLERFPPDSFQVLDEEEWEIIVQLRQDRTRPIKGTGGLDGSGRMVPAISDKFLRAVEEEVPLLGESSVVDETVWKDCVAHRFKAGGLTRPDGLMYPWPVLVEQLRTSGEFLLATIKKEKIKDSDKAAVRDKIQILNDAPMDVDLLKESGVGKTVKKFLKSTAAREGSFLDLDQPLKPLPHMSQETVTTRREVLEATLERWMAIAAQGGTEMKSKVAVDTKKPKKLPYEQELREAKKCMTWRKLFAVLEKNNEARKSNQGARMRERRQRLNLVRPKIVKVQPTTRKERNKAIITSQNSSNAPSKIKQLKMEASVTSSRRHTAAPMTKSPPSKAPPQDIGGFGAAVAFASVSRGGKKRKAASTTMVTLNGSKRMKIPDAKRAGSNLKKKLGLHKKGAGRR